MAAHHDRLGRYGQAGEPFLKSCRPTEEGQGRVRPARVVDATSQEESKE